MSQVSLSKVGEYWWSAVLEGEEHIDIDKINKERSMATVDEEEHAVLDRLTFDYHQKLQGKPQSHELVRGVWVGALGAAGRGAGGSYRGVLAGAVGRGAVSTVLQSPRGRGWDTQLGHTEVGPRMGGRLSGVGAGVCGGAQIAPP